MLLATFAERHRRPAWAGLAWVLLGLADAPRVAPARPAAHVAGGDSALDLGPYYAGRAHEALGATVLCVGALAAAAVALRPGRTRAPVSGT